MRIGRKEALIALVAGIIPWVHRRASAQVTGRLPVNEPVLRAPVQSAEIVDIQKRLAALEAQLANQVAFTKDAYGNLNLRGLASVTIDAGTNLSLRGGAETDLRAGATARIRGATIALN